jgi:hypothetical protein
VLADTLGLGRRGQLRGIAVGFVGGFAAQKAVDELLSHSTEENRSTDEMIAAFGH